MEVRGEVGGGGGRGRGRRKAVGLWNGMALYSDKYVAKRLIIHS